MEWCTFFCQNTNEITAKCAKDLTMRLTFQGGLNSIWESSVYPMPICNKELLVTTHINWMSSIIINIVYLTIPLGRPSKKINMRSIALNGNARLAYFSISSYKSFLETQKQLIRFIDELLTEMKGRFHKHSAKLDIIIWIEASWFNVTRTWYSWALGWPQQTVNQKNRSSNKYW